MDIRIISTMTLVFLVILCAQAYSMDIFSAIERRDIDICHGLVASDHILTNTRNFEGKTPLHLAAQYGIPELAKIFIENGAEI